MNSRHITGHAVDLAAIVDGKIRWDWPLYYNIANAMLEASDTCGVPIEWGAAWGRHLAAFESAESASQAYIDERKAMEKRPFLDGPHFQLPWNLYPVQA